MAQRTLNETDIERIAMTGDFYEIEKDGLVTIGFEFSPDMLDMHPLTEAVERVQSRIPFAIIKGSRTTMPESKYDRRGRYAKGAHEVFFVLADD